jgi:hypothetical protein
LLFAFDTLMGLFGFILCGLLVPSVSGRTFIYTNTTDISIMPPLSSSAPATHTSSNSEVEVIDVIEATGYQKLIAMAILFATNYIVDVLGEMLGLNPSVPLDNDQREEEIIEPYPMTVFGRVYKALKAKLVGVVILVLWFG